MSDISTTNPTTSFTLSPPPSSPQQPPLGEGDSVPDPLECLQENPVPPFLSKTFDLVDDPSLDQIISWGSAAVSFVVWDPMEFSRHVLPRNFKHNNFSSFVRQLNTYLPLLISGFRKIEADKWEFFNEYFQRGKRHLLKNIQRRRAPPQSQQLGIYIGPSGDAAKLELEVEVEKLKRERSVLMQEVVELQEQQRTTVQHAREVNQRLQSAELRQKQMVSFLARFFQNPTLLACNKHEKEQIVIDSPRVRRKFVKHHQHQTGTSGSLEEGQIVRYQADWRNTVPVEQSPQYFSQGSARELNEGSKNLTSQFETAGSHESGTVHDAMPTANIIGEGSSSIGLEDPLFKGKNVMSLNQEVVPEEYLVSFPDDLTKERGFPEFAFLGTENLDIWNTSYNVSGSGLSSVNDPWGDHISHEVPGFGVTNGISDMWDMNSLHAAGNLPSDEYPLVGQPKDNRNKSVGP